MSQGCLRGKNAVVTGGTAGIGKAIAVRFAREGAQVALLGTSRERGEAALAEIRSVVPDAQVSFHSVDVSDFSQVNGVMEQILQAMGTVDILVNNAGITRDNLLMKTSEEDWDKVLDINLKACFNTCKALVRPFIRARKGSIINVSSVVGITGNAGQAPYCASKAGMIGFTKSLAKELAPRHITANCIAPGFIQTAMTDQLTDQQKQQILGTIPLGRMGLTDEIAEAALFLAGDGSRYITGQVIVVDGGLAM